ncbi:MAG: DUF4115 domain-containing protein [Gammaproteobacteria bacterium]|jgi:cytoskeleton protein RodZ|nr:DUF4115 domain-containing protein [Gammaproteobacteria bacterium]
MTGDEMSREDVSRKERESEEAGKSGRDAQSAASRGPRAGARLKEARQARNISLEEVARELHLDAETLRDLEANRFGAFSAPVFTKGYLRRYAGLVGVPEARVLSEFDELSDGEGPPPVVIKPRPASARHVPSAQTVLVIVLAAVLGVLGWWAFSGAVLKPVQEVAGDAEPVLPVDGEAPAGATVAEDTPEIPLADEGVDEGAGESTEGTATETETGTTDRGDGAAPAPVAPAPEPQERVAAPAAAEIELVLSFSDECWLQVTGGDGDRVYAGIARGGQVRRFRAEPPVSLVLGNADAASIEVDGEPYVIDAADRRGRTARITVPGP